MRLPEDFTKEPPSKERLLSEEDPFVQYIVVRKSSLYDQNELLTSALKAVLAAETELAPKEEFKDSFDAWWNAAFRKVVLKAKEKHWQELASLSGTVSFGQVLATAPVQKSQRKEFFYKLPGLQVFNEDLDFSAFDRPETDADFLLYIQADMSLGKALAQVSHAVLKFSVEHQVPFGELQKASFAFVDNRLNQESVAGKKTSFIQDAGLTELVPGTKTVQIVQS